SRFREMYQPAADLLNPGIGFEELLRKTVARGCYADLGHREQAWIAARLQDFGKLRGLPEQQLRDGVWVSIAESRTQDGGTVCVHRDISAQRKAEEELMRRAALVQMLREIALETNEADNIPEAIQTCIDKVCAYTGFVIGHAWLPPERDETRELVPARLWYLREPQRYLAFREATEASRFAPGVGLPGRVWVSREPHWIDDLAEDVNFPRREVAVAAGLGSACAFPVLERDRVVAVLEFYSAGVIERDTPLLNAVAHLASQLGRVTERKRAVMALNKLRQAVEQSPAMIMITDRQGAIEYVNPEFSASTGYRPDEAIGRTPALLKSGQMEPEVYRVLWETITSGHDWRGEFLNLRKDGSTYWAATTVSPIRDQGGNVTHFLGIAEDVTERKRSEERIEHLAHFDPLTDLPNRALFQAQSRQILAAARRSGRPVALLMLDLDDFKDVNDSLGHAAGDRLLEQVAGRLKDCLREGDMVARLGGDEFALVLPEVEGPEAVDTAVRRLLEKVAEPYTLDELDLFVNASVGIALYPGDGEDAETLLKHADLALYRAKNRGRGTFNFFKPAMDQEVQQRKSLENDLRSALARGDLHLVYQPQVELENRRMTGVEALVRWHHPERGPISPAQFIPIAERSGLIVQLGEWVLEEACRQARAWRDAGMVELVVAVNLSPVQFKHPDLVGMVERVLRRSGLEAELLNLEITEGVVMQDTAANLKLIEALRAMGIRIALDDFGTGYSSLSYLTSLPVDKIKIDRSFVTALAEDPVRRSIVRSIVELGGALGKRVNVEGVETAEQLAVLVGHSVDEVQGYYFSPPVAAKEIQHMVARPAWQEQLPEQAPRSGATRQAG
ncbi:MAG TPA: EAL domain-containing protein, partial [Gammaproteobacteria bacterium]